ncbi:MAG: hypothetical protein V7637_1284 [Mycobacteriales bacterium]
MDGQVPCAGRQTPQSPTPIHTTCGAAPRLRSPAPARPTPTPEDAVGAIDLLVAKVPAPLPDVAQHVVQPPLVGRLAAGIVYPAAGVVRVPGDVVDLPVPVPAGAGLAGVLPLGVGRQAVAVRGPVAGHFPGLCVAGVCLVQAGPGRDPVAHVDRVQPTDVRHRCVAVRGGVEIRSRQGTVELHRDRIPPAQEGSDPGPPAAAAPVVSKIHHATGDANHGRVDRVVDRWMHAAALRSGTTITAGVDNTSRATRCCPGLAVPG